MSSRMILVDLKIKCVSCIRNCFLELDEQVEQWYQFRLFSNSGLSCLQIITNGKYRSAVHRALTNSRQPRLSVATFHDPAKTVKVSPVSELISESTPALYREVVYGDYVSSWYTKGPEGKRNIDALLLEP
ncbi:hypothetical protein FF1_045880 [Malus domestica]